MTKYQDEKSVKDLLGQFNLADIGVQSWLVENEACDEKAVFSVEQESLDFMKDLISDPTYKQYTTTRTEGIFLTPTELLKLINAAQKDGANL